MKVKAYSKPHRVGWLGWVDDEDGKLVGFVGFDGRLVFFQA